MFQPAASAVTEKLMKQYNQGTGQPDAGQNTYAQLVRMTTQSQRSAYLSGLHKTLQYAKTKARFPQNIHFGLSSCMKTQRSSSSV